MSSSKDTDTHHSIAIGLSDLSTPYLLTMTLLNSVIGWHYQVDKWKLCVPPHLQLPQPTRMPDEEQDLALTALCHKQYEQRTLARRHALTMTGADGMVPVLSKHSKSYIGRVEGHLAKWSPAISACGDSCTEAQMKTGMYNCLLGMTNQERNRDRKNMAIHIIDGAEWDELYHQRTSNMYMPTRG